MFFIPVENHVKIAVEDKNPRGKKAILMIHGWPLSRKIYEYQESLLLCRDYRVITLDLRGFGDSDAPACGYSYDRMAQDIYHVVRALGLRDFILVGFSMGGAIVIRYMSRCHGYGVKKLALLGAAAPSFVQRPGYPYGMTRAQVDGLIAQALTDRPRMTADFGKMLFANPQSEESRQWFWDLSLQASGTGTIQTACSLRDEDLREDLKAIKVPTGIFHGAKDRICPFPFAEAMHAGIPHSSLYAFENSGHAVFYDDLPDFNHRFLLFLESEKF